MPVGVRAGETKLTEAQKKERRKAARDAFKATPEGRAKLKAYKAKFNAKPETVAKRKAYDASPDRRAKAAEHKKAYLASPEGKAKAKAAWAAYYAKEKENLAAKRKEYEAKTSYSKQYESQPELKARRNAKRRKATEELSDQYIARLIRHHDKIPVADLPLEALKPLIPLKRVLIQIERTINEKRQRASD